MEANRADAVALHICLYMACSHPLYGQTPDEVDTPQDVASGQVPGIKRAAARKLMHELGIPASQLSTESYRFLTRLHYCAPDNLTYGEGAEWGEHEMDYILFAKVCHTCSIVGCAQCQTSALCTGLAQRAGWCPVR